MNVLEENEISTENRLIFGMFDVKRIERGPDRDNE